MGAAGGGVPAIRTSYETSGLTTTTSINGVVSGVTTVDGLGRTVSSIDQTGAETTYAYSNGGRTRETTLPGGITLVDDSYLDALARAVAGGLGGKVGVAPRLFLKKLVADVLDRVELHADFDPRQHYSLTLAETEMSATERAAASATSVDDIEL